MKRVPILILAALCLGCSTQSKIDSIKKESLNASLSLVDESELPEIIASQAKRDTLTVTDDNGKEVLIMKASLDENGEMVANDVITASKVTARFRNVAERHGKVTLSFDISVPKAMQDSRWQLRFYPDMYILGDSTRLEPILITGSAYRKAQLRGYQQYRKFLSSIITDSTQFQFRRQLEIFLERNLPEIYRFKEDSSFVSDETFESYYGVSEKEAVRHYTNWMLVRHNQRKIAMKDKYFRKYVKSPIQQEGLRLDTVIVNSDNDLTYRYSQVISALPGLRKADIVLSGEIYEQDRRLLQMPRGDSLTFYISSLSSLVDDTERYLTRIVERKVGANASFSIDFGTGRTDIDLTLGDNREQIGMVKRYLTSLAENKDFDLDSILVSSSCSPEGSAKLNSALSLARSESVGEYFGRFLKEKMDSLRKDEGVLMDIGGNYLGHESREIPFISKSKGENWEMLSSLVGRDSTLSTADKFRFSQILGIRDIDEREATLKKEPFYAHLKDELYPRLRNVNFDFRLHRKGMVKDTVHTTVLDSTYLKGVEALRSRDYKTAASILRPYRDYNAAVALCALDYDASAMDILQELGRNDRAEYLLAILYSRKGDYANAVQCYLNACSLNRTYISRGNLDPEISELINTYGLNKNLYQ